MKEINTIETYLEKYRNCGRAMLSTEGCDLDCDRCDYDMPLEIYYMFVGIEMAIKEEQ